VSLCELSAIVITKNEAHCIERCLRSVAFADEIIVLDSGSTDGTLEIAARCGARVTTAADWPGFGPQKNRALALASGRWVLSIDADEQVDDELAGAIRFAVAADGQGCNGYWVRRSSRFCGQQIRFGDWRGDRVLRLFRREGSQFSADLVHERVLCPKPHAQLSGLMLHDSVDTMQDAIQKTRRYAQVGAIRLRERGRGGLLSACIHAAWTFLRGYLIRLGFLDGRYGLTIAALNAWGTYMRYRLAGRPPEHHDPGDSR
jgi:glycosyltransferase involved in cell wall biosynthesis